MDGTDSDAALRGAAGVLEAAAAAAGGFAGEGVDEAVAFGFGWLCPKRSTFFGRAG